MANHSPEGLIEAVAVSVSNKGMLLGGATGFVGWLAQVNWIGIIGVAVAVLGLAANIYFQVRRDRREAAESAARLAALREQCL